jgi:two-component system response regulator AtoC
METRVQVLIVDHESGVGHYLKAHLGSEGVSAEWLPTEAACTERLRNRHLRPNLILLDSVIPGADTIQILRTIRKMCPDLPVVIMARFFDPKLVLAASLNGASDFLQKPIFPEDLARFKPFLNRSPHSIATQPCQSVHIEELGEGNFFLAASASMRKIWAEVNTLARTDVPVLITGESGVGKEVVARLLHRNSLRASRSMLKVNCAALPVDLLESELFGYEAGAFTGAMKSKPGKFELCDKGTILLDEIGEMSPQLQAKLLHVLQDGQFSRLGARANTTVDVRILAATNINIEQALAERRLREDLYYRLNAFVIDVPPLRERREEIPYLLNELSHRLAVTNHLDPIHFSPGMIGAALEYHWPGNLRELGNFVKHYLIVRDEASTLAHLGRKTNPPFSPLQRITPFQPPRSSESDLKAAVRSVKDETEIKMIREVLDQANWNRRIAAEKLQISYKALLYKIRQYQLEVPA